MANFNRIIIMGNLTRDPDYKQLSSGQATCKLGVASNRQFKNKQTGAMVQEVCFIDVDVWGPQAESCRQYLQKGRAVLVEGRLKFDTWKDIDGQSRSKHTIVADRVVFLSGPAQNSTENISESSDGEERLAPRNQHEKDLLDQIEELKSRNTDKKVEKKSSTKKSKAVEMMDDSSDGMFKEGNEFKDEPPFQDDLPF